MSDEGSIVLALMLAGAITAAGDISHGHLPPARIAVGVFVGAFLLMIVATFEPRLGVGLAVVTAVTAFVLHGQEAFGAIGTAVSNQNGAVRQAPKPIAGAVQA